MPISVSAENQQSSSAAAMNSMLSLQQQGSNPEPICKIKRHALEALFNTHFAGDNGVLSGKNVRFIFFYNSIIGRQKLSLNTCLGYLKKQLEFGTTMYFPEDCEDMYF